MEKRVIFPRGKQKKFLLELKIKSKLTWMQLSKILNIKKQTLEKSYTHELCSLPYFVFPQMCDILNVPKNKIMNKYHIKLVNFNPIIGRKAFGENRTTLPNLKIDFNTPIPLFDCSAIKRNKFDADKNFKFPNKLTPKLAEEIGMHYGDGFLSNEKFEYRLKGNKNERAYYDCFIKKLYKNLFGLDLNMKEYETTYGFELYSKAFWLFKTQILKIPAGRKDNIKFPEIIKTNDIDILCSFIRGVFDTDGCISFIKKYREFGNYYPSISLSLKSKDLIIGVAEILSMLGLEPKIYLSTKEECHQIYLNGYKRLETYSKLIGWHNPKNINKVINWKNKYPLLSKGVMVGMV